MKRLSIVVGGVVGIAIFVASSLPAFSAGSGTINATVTANGACLELTQASVDFGTLPFSTSGVTNNTNKAAGSVKNCSGQAEHLLGRGTDATNDSGTKRWTLAEYTTDICLVGTDKYALTANAPSAGTQLVSSADRQIGTFFPAAGDSETLNVGLVMPCTGSTGAGERENFSYVFTATF